MLTILAFVNFIGALFNCTLCIFIFSIVDELEFKPEKANELSKESYDTNVQLQRLITPLLDIGTDIGFREDHSWAVVCIKGKPEYVKFMPLDSGETREVINFLKRYERSNHIIDSPLAFRNIIKNELFI